jgi:DNA-binding protein H-NS
MVNTAKLNTLRAKIKELEKQAKRIESQSDRGVSEAAELIRRFDLNLADWKRAWTLSSKRAPIAKSDKRRKRRKVPIKYADAKGNKWSGRGRLPLWLVAAQKSGKKREDFLVKSKHTTGTSIH